MPTLTPLGMRSRVTPRRAGEGAFRRHAARRRGRAISSAAFAIGWPLTPASAAATSAARSTPVEREAADGRAITSARAVDVLGGVGRLVRGDALAPTLVRTSVDVDWPDEQDAAAGLDPEAGAERRHQGQVDLAQLGDAAAVIVRRSTTYSPARVKPTTRAPAASAVAELVAHPAPPACGGCGVGAAQHDDVVRRRHRDRVRRRSRAASSCLVPRRRRRRGPRHEQAVALVAGVDRVVDRPVEVDEVLVDLGTEHARG